jgi:hypothetical protein
MGLYTVHNGIPFNTLLFNSFNLSADDKEASMDKVWENGRIIPIVVKNGKG